ncbi:envelope stress response membrane protein PspC [Yunchengibacter salinarum]|uniref:envelope stress response membrane protein PspC n=1 Tax=Yunchengibacter salinarum TaxID=3133399 RepID=UPI0035B658AA
MTTNSPTKLYKRPENGKVMGVCAGVSDYFGINVTAVRVLTVFGAFMTGFWPVLIIYFILGFILEPEPAGLYADDEEERFWRQTRTAPDYSLAELKRRFREMERRTADMEAYMTSRRFRLDREIRSLED